MGDVQTKDGQVIQVGLKVLHKLTNPQNLLVVNERVLLFENIGATKEIAKILQNELERVDDIDDRVEGLQEGISIFASSNLYRRSEAIERRSL